MIGGRQRALAMAARPGDMTELLALCRDRLLAAQLAPGDAAEQRLRAGSLVDAWLGDWGFSGQVRDLLLAELLADLTGAGPLEPLLGDPTVTEIMVNGPGRILVERDGRISPVAQRFRDAEHLRSVIDRLLLASGRRLDDASPMVDARLADGSRLNAVLPPVALDGPHLTIRRSARIRSCEDLLDSGSIDGQVLAFLHAAILGRCNLLVTGATGAGKTTLLAALAALVPEQQRIVTLEDVAELRIDHPSVVGLECRAHVGDGAMDVSLRDLVRNSLRMRPDRIVVGEVRGAEAADMVQAMNTGHEGSMATLHANNAADAVRRLEGMLATAWPGLGMATLRSWWSTALDVVVHCERGRDGHRAVSAVAVVERHADRDAELLPLFQRSSADRGGRLQSCGAAPRSCLERMARHGVVFPLRLLVGGRAA